MAIIENASSPEAVDARIESLNKMDRAELIAQQLVQRGAEHVLASLQAAGVTPENCAAMLDSLRHGLIVIHTVAEERGILLPDYSPPDDMLRGPKS